jgi:hypothetical protein
MAFIGKSPLTGPGTTTATPVYASATAGNLLSAMVVSHCTTPSTLSGATTGWTLRKGVYTASVNVCEIWEKIAVGSDTMPTWNFAAGVESAVIVAEFSSTVTIDQSGSGNGTSSPVTATNSGTDGGTGRLIVVCAMIRPSTVTTTTATHNVNSLGVGTGINIIGDNTATAGIETHQHSIYVTTATTGSVADNDVVTATGTLAHFDVAIASYAAAGTVANGDFLAFM